MLWGLFYGKLKQYIMINEKVKGTYKYFYLYYAEVGLLHSKITFNLNNPVDLLPLPNL